MLSLYFELEPIENQLKPDKKTNREELELALALPLRVNIKINQFNISLVSNEHSTYAFKNYKKGIT